MDVNENFERLEHHINRLTGVLETLRKENDELSGEVQSLQERNGTLQAEIQSLQEKIGVASRENEQFKKDKEAVKERIEQLLIRLDSAVSSEDEQLEQVEQDKDSEEGV